MKTTILSIVNVTKTYVGRNPVHALRGVSLDIYAGEIIALLGVNGAGKTTLSSIIATLHPPTSGALLFNGSSIYEDLTQYRMSLGYCAQRQNLDPYLTVAENLRFAGRYYLMSPEAIEIRLEELLRDLELKKYIDFMPDQLSGGTRQRVMIARALMHSPKIVILDEPTVGLDPDIRKKLWTHIYALKEKGITTILTTHYLDEAEALADRVCILHQGLMLMTQSVQELKSAQNKERLEDAFLALLSSKPQDNL